ncbi:MAG: 3-phosphoshikimate 1-carboxyvinyltransferase [Actinobacteria bacterium]|nr:3-phosphoshikimate 1-carboxyvinyltransferase [Actinomycetota bacterium]
MRAEVNGPCAVNGEISVPGDKSISHRAALLGSVSDGICRITGFSPAGDCASTLEVLRALGVKIRRDGSDIEIEGTAGRSFGEPVDVLDAGNSGTTMRLGCGLLASMPIQAIITGDESLRARPMNRIIKPLKLMGADINGNGESGCPPLEIRGGDLRGIEYSPDVASAQVKSAILLAGLQASGRTTVNEKAPTRDHTERMLRHMGASVLCDGTSVTVKPCVLSAVKLEVPGDMSSAAFLIAAGLACPGSSVKIKNVGLNPSRTGFLEILRRMGAGIELLERSEEGWEPRGTLKVKHSRLKAVDVTDVDVVAAIDEVMLIALLATQAEGVTRIRGASELRKKESDRIDGTVKGLISLGARVNETPDGMEIKGPCELGAAVLDSNRDHRLAMMWSVAGMLAKGKTVVTGWEWASVSYPGFEGALSSLGVNISAG